MQNVMKPARTFSILSIAFLLILNCCLLGPALAQEKIVSTAKSQQGNMTTGLGRDFWLAIPQNYDMQSGKYFNLYIASIRDATVFVDVPGKPMMQLQVAAGQVMTLTSPDDIPLASELYSSNVIERKAIHVWSDDADLSVYLLSRNPYTTDGMYVIPTNGWGKEYVVAAYGSLYEGIGTQYDYPSEFIVIGHRDNTNVTIVPSCDIRDNKLPTTVIHPKHVPFTVTLNEGDCIQYQAVLATNTNDYDVSGTMVVADHAVGVIGASACTNIPGDFPYCDHILEMIPPVRTLSNAYFTAPFANRVGGDSYLVIATQTGQSVYRNGTMHHTFANANERYYQSDITEASEWTSDAPFFLAQYINSTTWPDPNVNDNKGIGDPAMVVINPSDQFRSTVVFQTPTITVSDQHNFTNYVNLIMPISEEPFTTLDNTPIASIPGIERLPIGASGWQTVRVKFAPGTGEGTHVVDCQSGTGIGVYLYGYGAYDSYTWAGNLGVVSPQDSDKFPPHVEFGNTGLSTQIALSEIQANDSKINAMTIDSLVNMKFEKDAGFYSGEGASNAYYTLTVNDPSKPALAVVSTYDMAGNRTQVKSTFAGTGASVSSEGYTSQLAEGSSEYLALRGKLDRGDKLAMLPVIPNPATLSSRMPLRFLYALGESSPVDLMVFDMLGNRIATIVNQDAQRAGIYEAVFTPGKNMLPGAYLYRLSGAGKVLSGKLILDR
jgi:IgGFc binding protein